jgi:predicted transcriptional regulator
MRVDKMLTPTKVATAGMTVREVFEECSRANTPGLPFCDDDGQICGRVTLKHILKKSCLPDYLVEMARVLGEQLSGVQDMAVKALAMMEQSDTSYIYVVDEGRYKGVVTIHSLAETLASYDNPPASD